jgi:hypothetical protein
VRGNLIESLNIGALLLLYILIAAGFMKVAGKKYQETADNAVFILCSSIMRKDSYRTIY